METIMEFKRRVIKKQKKQKADNKRDSGMVRVKVRGRKRWIMPTKKEAAAK